MLLSEKTIREKIQSKDIVVKIGEQQKSETELEFDTASLEVHLSDEFRIWKDLNSIGLNSAVDPAQTNFNFVEYHKSISEVANLSEGKFKLGSQCFVLAITQEYIKLPNNIVGFIQGKSKLARMGLAIHLTAPTIQAGWGGKITLEIYNASPMPVLLTPGMKIGQLLFHQLDQDSIRKESDINDQKTTGG